MKTKDIIQLIETCAKHNVKELTFEGVNVIFNGHSEPEKQTEFGPTPSAAIPKSAEEDDKDQVADLLVSDPLEMEKRIVDGELVDVEND